jgi:hypothetical protein
MVRADAAGADERDLRFARFGGVEQRKGQVVRIGRERAGGERARLAPRVRVGRRCGEFAQQHQLPFAEDARRVVAVRADDAADAAVVVGNRAVGERVVRLFGKAVALHDEELLFDERAFDTRQRRREQWRDVGPDLAPDDFGRLAERNRVLAADDRLVRVVIEEDEFAAPADPDRLARGQHDADGRLQALRPSLGAAERRRVPVVRAHQRAHLAAAREKARGDAGGSRVPHQVIWFH